MSAETAENDPNKKRVRKKRKNFLANAKKYAKKGQMGRGARMPEELYQYFVGILDAMKAGIEDKEERVALVNNVLERTKGEELNVVGNQLGCRVIELLLPFASSEDIERFIDILSPELRRLCSDNFTSHVVETLLRVCAQRATEGLQKTEEEEEEVPKKKKKKDKTQPENNEEHVKKCYDFTLKICKYALNNLEDFVWDTYANHILRSAIKCLSGITLLPGEKPKTNIFKETVADDKGIPPHLTTMEYKVVPDEFKDLVKEFANRLSVWPQFKDLPYQNLTSALLQVLLYAIKNVDSGITKDLLKKLLNESFAPEGWSRTENDEKKDDKIDLDSKDNVNGDVPISTFQLAPVFENQSATRLLEAVLFVAKKKMYTQIYARCFINRLSQLATMPMLNFTVQRLIDNCQIKEEFEPMFDEISGSFGALLACGNSGVLVALARAALRIRARQAHFIQSLETALKCSDASPKLFSVSTLRLVPADRVDESQLDKEYFIHVHGSVILQTVLEFQRPAKAVSSLLELSGDEILVILCDAKGSHIADSFCRSLTVGVKARDKLLWRLKGLFQTLALNKHGSRAFEAIFSAATIEQQVRIMTELSDKSGLLQSTPFGRLLADKLALETFRHKPKEWEQLQMKKNKKENK